LFLISDFAIAIRISRFVAVATFAVPARRKLQRATTLRVPRNRILPLPVLLMTYSDANRGATQAESGANRKSGSLCVHVIDVLS
jgi:hypothetical protein